MSVSFPLANSPRVPCEKGIRLSSSAYTPAVQMDKTREILIPAETKLSNLNIGVAYNGDPTQATEKVPFLNFSIQEGNSLVSAPIVWNPIPDNPKLSYGTATLRVIDQSGNPSTITLNDDYYIAADKLPLNVYFLTHLNEDKTLGKVMHMIGGESVAGDEKTQVNGQLFSDNKLFGGTIPNGVTQVSGVSFALNTSGNLANCDDISFQVSGKPQETCGTRSNVQFNGPSLTWTFESPMKVSSSNQFKIISKLTPFAGNSITLLSPGGGGGRRADGFAYTDNKANLIYDAESPFCDFFSGNPLLRSETPAKGCIGEDCVTFVNPPPLSTTARFDVDANLFYKTSTTFKQSHVAPIGNGTPESSSVTYHPMLSGQDTCANGSFCNTNEMCGNGHACCFGKNSSGTCYNTNECQCTGYSIHGNPTFKPVVHYYPRTPFGLDDGINFHCVSIPNGVCNSPTTCCRDMASYITSSPGTVTRPACPIGTTVQQTSCDNQQRYCFYCKNQSFCSEDADCGTNSNCIAGYCGCDKGGNCPNGQICEAGLCYPKKDGLLPFRGSYATIPPFDIDGNIASLSDSCCWGTGAFNDHVCPSINNYKPPSDRLVWENTINTSANLWGQEWEYCQWYGIHSTLNSNITPSVGNWYLSKSKAGVKNSGDVIGPTLLNAYKLCTSGADCATDQIKQTFYGSNCSYFNEDQEIFIPFHGPRLVKKFLYIADNS